MAHTSHHIARSAGLISVATLISRVLGLVREQMIAYLFSRTATDAFYVAFRIPNLLRDLFAEGAMSSAFVPTFTEYLKKRSAKEAWQLASHVLSLLLIALSVICFLGILSSNWLISQFAGEFRSIPEKFDLTVVMTQIMFPFLPLIALAAVVMGVLNAQGTFFLPALAPALFNLGSIGVAIGLYSWLKSRGINPIIGMAVGTLAGGLLQLMVQIPPLVRAGFRFSFGLDFRHPGVQRILLLLGPGTLGLASTQVNILVNTWLATQQGEGPVSWLNYAFRLMQFPLGIFGVAIATAALPTISTHVANRDHASLGKTISDSLRMVLLINIPASVGLMVLSRPIIALIYQHGRFKASDTIQTANALIFYSIGLFAYSAVKVLVPAFYALGRSHVPVAISAVTVAFNVASNLLLVGPLGFRGLALGTSLASLFNLFLLLYWMRRYAVSIDYQSNVKVLVKILLAAGLMGLGCFASYGWMENVFTPLRIWQVGIALCASIVFGLLILILSAKVLRVSELETIWQLVLKRIRPPS
ncbi:MAG: murein biosynthesis integral membrane protein MurJ [Terriglobia bacterium]